MLPVAPLRQLGYSLPDVVDEVARGADSGATARLLSRS
jgi:hypothetical protein